jgi:hypothetical protein
MQTPGHQQWHANSKFSLSGWLCCSGCRLQARETGICPVREELYSQCLDELIRQVTISCAERGLLLLRVRDEMRMTTAAYQVKPSEHSTTAALGIACAWASNHIGSSTCGPTEHHKK